MDFLSTTSRTSDQTVRPDNDKWGVLVRYSWLVLHCSGKRRVTAESAVKITAIQYRWHEFCTENKKNVTVTLNGIVRGIMHYWGSHSGADDSSYILWDFPEKGGSNLLQNVDTYVRVLSGNLSQKFEIFETIVQFKTCWILNLNSPVATQVCPCLFLLCS